jgi:hypothetical protein
MMENNNQIQIARRHYAGIFLLSLATLLLELSLTRVLSVALWYHFGFLVISTALLGFGASGVVLALWINLRERIPLDRALATLSLLFGVVTIISFWTMQRIPFDPFSLLADKRQLLFMPLYYIAIAAPFFCSGLAFALLLTRGVKNINRLYAFDLIGAGVGCAAIAIVMPAFGGSGSVVVAAMLGLFAAAVFGFERERKLAVAGAALAAVALPLALFAGKVLPISVTANKAQPPRAPIYTAWNTFSRIDVFENPGNPRTGVPPNRRFVFDAGTAATGMIDLRPNVRAVLARPDAKIGTESGVAYVGKTNPKILIIGSGAGDQVLEALKFKARSITAVEINPIINDLAANRMRDYWGDLFNQPEVRLVTEEGRSFVRRSNEKYDAIISVHTISNAAVASGALSLAENYVLTRDAFEDYLDHLEPDGVIFFTRPESQLPRLFATAREVFEQRGMGNPANRLFAYRYANLPERGIPSSRQSFHAGFVLKRTPITPEDLQTMMERIGSTSLAAAAPDKPEIIYSPLEPVKADIFNSLLTAPDLKAVYSSNKDELAPATDDRPFFNQHTRWSSLNLNAFTDVFAQGKMGRMALEDRPVAEITLITLLVQSIVIAAILVLMPLYKFSRQGLQSAPNRWNFLGYFAALGFGFIMIEIALMQRFTLFLGQPIYTFAVVLASLLVSTGIGAHFAGRFRPNPRQAILYFIPVLLVALLLTALLTPVVFNAALGLSLIWRVVLAVLMIAPLGVLLGMPFPTGLSLVGQEAAPLVPWAWGVNGFFTVIGSVSALILGMAFGFKIVLIIAAVCYALALAAIFSRNRVSTQSEAV